jgi:hypothetical protein
LIEIIDLFKALEQYWNALSRINANGNWEPEESTPAPLDPTSDGLVTWTLESDHEAGFVESVPHKDHQLPSDGKEKSADLSTETIIDPQNDMRKPASYADFEDGGKYRCKRPHHVDNPIKG